MMKKMSLTLKVFLIALAVCVLYVLIATIVRVSIGQIASDMAVTRFIIGSIISLVIAGIAAGITALVVAIKQKKKLSLPLKVFLIAAPVAILYVLIRTIIRVNTGEITTEMAVARFIIGSIMYVAGAGVIAGITAIVVAVKKLGE
jgi:Ca2+/H+ antiporter